MPNLRSRGSLSSMIWHISTRSLRVVGSPPETFAFSMCFHSPESNIRSISSSVMSDLRSPRVQLLHISQRASQTNVQCKIKTVGWIALTCARPVLNRSRGAARSGFEEVPSRVNLCH